MKPHRGSWWRYVEANKARLAGNHKRADQLEAANSKEEEKSRAKTEALITKFVNNWYA
jgi:hypothetical protein